MTNEAGKVRRFRFGIPGRDSGTLVGHDDGAYMYYADYEASERRVEQLEDKLFDLGILLASIDMDASDIEAVIGQDRMAAAEARWGAPLKPAAPGSEG